MKKTFLLYYFMLAAIIGLSAQTKVSFMPHWLHQAQFSGFYMAQEKGIYEKYGLDVQILDGGPLAPMSLVFKNNEADFGTMFLSGAIELYDDGEAIVNLCQLSQKSALMFVAKKSSNISRVEDFNGKKIGIWRSDFRELPMAFIDQFNIRAEIFPITSTIDLFLDDGIDIMCVMWYNEYNQIYNAGLDYEELNTFFFFDYDLNFPEDGIYCHKEFYHQNPDVCADFIKATIEGWRYAFDHPEETIDIVLQYMKKRNIPANRAHQKWMLSIIQKVFESDDGSISGELTKEDFLKTSQILFKSGSIKTMPVLEEFIGE